MSQMPPGQPMSYSQPPQQKSVGLAVASMVLGILSIVLCCFWPVSIPMAIIAIVLGFIARGKAARGEAGGGGMAVAGIVCAIIALILWLIAFMIGHFGGPAAKSWLDKIQHKAEQRLEEEQRKQQERQNQGTTTQESLFEQGLKARNLAIVLD